MFSKESTVFEVVLDDDIRDGIKDKCYVIGVSGTCEMSIDLFGVFALVQILKFHLDVSCGIVERIRTWNKNSDLISHGNTWTTQGG